MGLLLDISLRRLLEKVLYFASYIVIDPGTYPSCQAISCSPRASIKTYYEKYEDDFRVGMGAEAIKELLSEPDT